MLNPSGATPNGATVTSTLDLAEGLRDRRRYLRELDCARGLAILLVFLFHAWGLSSLQLPGSPTPGLSLIAGGNTGVTLFFVLSGFLLSLPWLRHAADATQPKPLLAAYFKARALRIVPLYYVALLLTWLLTGNTATVARAALFQFVGFQAFPYSVVWWTLVTEVQFYLLLPVGMVLWTGGRWPRLLCIALLLAWAACYANLVLFGELASDKSFLLTKSVFARAPAFLAGIAAAAIWLRLLQGSALSRQRPLARWGVLLLLLTALVLLERLLLAVTQMGTGAAESSWHIHHSYEAALWAVIMLCLLLGDLPAKGLLVNRGLAIVGKLSYSLYLVHVPVLFYLIYPMRESMGAAAYHASGWLYLVPMVALALSLALSLASYQWLEKPFLRRKRALPV